MWVFKYEVPFLHYYCWSQNTRLHKIKIYKIFSEIPKSLIVIKVLYFDNITTEHRHSSLTTTSLHCTALAISYHCRYHCHVSRYDDRCQWALGCYDDAATSAAHAAAPRPPATPNTSTTRATRNTAANWNRHPPASTRLSSVGPAHVLQMISASSLDSVSLLRSQF